MSDPAFFGYGSLVNVATHDYADPRPAMLHGWRRVWRKTNLREAAYLSVEPANDSTLRGLIIHTREFPGWDSFGAMVGHMRFVRDHHERIGKIALVTDSAVGDLAETIGGHFVVATVRHYDFDDRDSAREWMLQG